MKTVTEEDIVARKVVRASHNCDPIKRRIDNLVESAKDVWVNLHKAGGMMPRVEASEDTECGRFH